MGKYFYDCLDKIVATVCYWNRIWKEPLKELQHASLIAKTPFHSHDRVWALYGYYNKYYNQSTEDSEVGCPTIELYRSWISKTKYIL